MTAVEQAPIETSEFPDVLVVDDDPLVAALIQGYLSSAGYPVQTAGDGAEALKIFASRSPQIVILDWVMPGIDGPSLCRTIRSIRSSFPYIIMLTAQSAKQKLLEAFDAGVDDFLAKPCDREEMLARLRAGVRVLRLQRELARRVRETTELNVRLDRLNHQLDRLAHTDDLTSLPNRRQAMALLERHWRAGERNDAPLAALMIDLDDFKKLNDTHGHGIGDAVLRDVGTILQRGSRSSDVACRVGGEEFLVLLPGQDAASAAVVAERLRQMVGDARLPLDNPTVPVTLSIGVAQRHCGMNHFEELLTKADGALYAAKRLGKNRVYIAPGEPAFTSDDSRGAA